jgi:sec-independent protein translocase protein TatA
MFGLGLGPSEVVLLLGLGLLLFGNRLPELARSLGKSVIEFRNGVRGIESDILR